MNEPKIISELLDTVGTLRGEMRVQANLAHKEAKDELHRLEERWKTVSQDVGQQRERVAEIVEETAEESWAGIRLTLEELRDGYRKLRDL